MFSFLLLFPFSVCKIEGGHGPHSANFEEKVHKPQSKSYGRIGAKMQHMSYEFEYFYECITTFRGLSKRDLKSVS